MSEIKKIYVSVNGCDCGDGSENKPLATLSGAIEEVKSAVAEGKGAEVLFHGGEYKVGGIIIDEAASGSEATPVTYKAYGDGEVVFNSGATLDIRNFKPVPEEIRERLKPEARDHVLCYDLKEHGITRELLGPVYAVGAHNTASRYGKEFQGKNAEIFWNDKRMKLARYPNKGFLKIESVLDFGEGIRLADGGEFNPKWSDKSYPGRGGKITVDDETLAEIKTWKDLSTAWCFGYFYVDWADATTPINKIDLDEKSLKFGMVSPYGYLKGANYYLFNVLEELDMPGEYYIDRENLIAYVYPPEPVENSRAVISLSRENMITAEKINYVTFEGITFKAGRGDALILKGDHNTVKNCHILDFCGFAIRMTGVHNTVYGCEIERMGEGCVEMTGGDRDTLTHSENLIENCYMHNFSELFRTYHGAVHLNGCGSTVRHNEFANCPHLVLSHQGNEHLVEYNYIHEAVQESNDAGAFYTGLDGAAHGTVSRYNLFVNVGNDMFTPCGIYWDDTLSGQTAIGNIFYNVTGKALMVGGGRDHVIKNNIAINSEYPILFDDRLRAGFDRNGWFGNRKDWYLSTVKAHPVDKEPWASRYPHLKELTADGSDPENINFCPNPSYAVIENNVFVPYHDWGICIEETVKKFGTVRNNLCFASAEECTTDGKYTLKEEVKKLLPGFEDIPVDKIGRYKD